MLYGVSQTEQSYITHGWIGYPWIVGWVLFSITDDIQSYSRWGEHPTHKLVEFCCVILTISWARKGRGGRLIHPWVGGVLLCLTVHIHDKVWLTICTDFLVPRGVLVVVVEKLGKIVWNPRFLFGEETKGGEWRSGKQFSEHRDAFMNNS